MGLCPGEAASWWEAAVSISEWMNEAEGEEGCPQKVNQMYSASKLNYDLWNKVTQACIIFGKNSFPVCFFVLLKNISVSASREETQYTGWEHRKW